MSTMDNRAKRGFQKGPSFHDSVDQSSQEFVSVDSQQCFAQPAGCEVPCVPRVPSPRATTSWRRSCLIGVGGGGVIVFVPLLGGPSSTK
eukprot:2190004-Pyramimonas_sp.AAC.1